MPPSLANVVAHAYSVGRPLPLEATEKHIMEIISPTLMAINAY